MKKLVYYKINFSNIVDLLKNLCMKIEHQRSCLLLSTVGINNNSALKMQKKKK